MNRSFGYYFSQTCLIPVADMVNHSCQAVDHQLVSRQLEKGEEFHESYFPRKDKIDCSLLGVESETKPLLPFRHRFLLDNKIIENSQEEVMQLDRAKIN